MVKRPHGVAHREFNWQRVDWTPDLHPGEIHLWLLNKNILETLLYHPAFKAVLNDTEIYRASHIVDREKRELYIAGRIGLRLLLQKYIGQVAGEIEFLYGLRGKPSLGVNSDGCELHFNYAVSSGHAFYGFSYDCELGVDLEIYPRNINVKSFVRRILSSEEQKAWASISKSDKNNAMLCCWTRKEAYGKLLGVGIRYNMQQSELFFDLENDHWSSKVSGLFVEDHSRIASRVYGVQVGLPASGAASIMYDNVTGHDSDYKINHPDILAFEPFGNFWRR